MKTKYLIKLTCFALLLVCWQNVNAQYYTERTPVLDTSKIDYEIVNPKKIHRYYYLNIVNDMYFYDFDTTKVIRITGGMPYSGELGNLQNFESTKKYRYHITDNEIFNRLLPECDFYYELTKYGKERVIAQYNGKFFRYEDFNYLMREMGKGELPQIAKTKILAQWRLWMFDQDVHIMSMDTVEHRIPGKKYRIKDTNDSIVYSGKYYIRHEGNIEVEGEICNFTVSFLNDKRIMHEFGAYYSSENRNNDFGVIAVSLLTKNIYTNNTRSSNGIELRQDGSQISPKVQDGKSVFYYTNNSGNTQIKYNEVSDLGGSTKFRFYKSTGALTSNITLVYETSSLNVDSFVEFDLTGILLSGIYLIKYQDITGNWQLIQDIVLIPEEIDATHTIAGTNFTLEIHYLEQSFDSEADMNLYVWHMKSTFDEVMEKWTGYYQKYITPEGLVDDDNVIPLYVIFPAREIVNGQLEEEKTITFFQYDDDNDMGAGFTSQITPNVDNTSAFLFRSQYSNELYSQGVYQNIYSLLKSLIAHETHHWIQSSYSINLRNHVYNGNLSWIREGLSVMAQAEAFPELELQPESRFCNHARGFLTNPPKNPVDGIIWKINNEDPDRYSLGLFFYFIHEKCGIDHIAVFKELMQKIDTYVPSEIVNDDNLYETSIENLFETALTKTSDYNHFNELLVDFVEEVYHKKAFIANTLDYSDLTIYEFSPSIVFSDLYSFKYTGMGLYKKTIVSQGEMTILCEIDTSDEKYGRHNFMVSKWDASNNFISGSIQEKILNQENVSHAFNVEVNSGEKVIVTKLNLDKEINISGVYTITFTQDYDLVSDFSSDTEYASTGQTVQFQNESSGNNLSSYYWTFEGGTPSHSTAENPLVTYSTVGTYDVSLQVNEEDGETLTTTKEDYMHIVGEGELLANFSANNSIINAGETVTFINQSLGEIDTYFWEFEGGTPETSNSENPQVSYSTSGLFDVRLTVTNTDGSRSMVKSNYISVYDENSNDLICYADQLSDKTASFQVLYTGVHDSYDMTCTVDFGDQLYEVNESSMPPFDFLHTYQDYDTYEPEASLEIRDLYDEIIFSGGCSCPVVSLVNPDPCGDLSIGITSSPSNPAYLDGETSEVEISFTGNVTGGVPPYHWHWAFLNDEYTGVSPVGGETGGIATATSFSQSFGSITYNIPGNYRLFVSVMDAYGCVKDIYKSAEVRRPFECISDIEIQNYDQRIKYRRLIIPKDHEDCFLSFRYKYELYPFTYGDNSSTNICWSCINSYESYQWQINGVNTVYNDDLSETLRSGWGVFNVGKQLECYSSSFTRAINHVRVKLWGRPGSDDNSTKCLKEGSITVARPDCASITNTYDFVNFEMSSDDLIRLQPIHTDMYEYISGYFELNSHVNSIIDENSTLLTACNGIVLQDGFETGTNEFVAQVESFSDNCYTNSNEKVLTCNYEDVNDADLYLSVSPNPVAESFSIRLFQTYKGNSLIQIINSEGKLVMTIVDDLLEEGYHTIFVENFNFAPGLYLCKYTFNGIVLSEKIIKH